MGDLSKHLKTIRIHRKYVRQACFKMELYWQGLTHDLSKYSPAELSIAKYYGGTKSPHQMCRDQIGYSPSWIHHYHRNPSHWEYWIDTDSDGVFIPIKMPYKYVVESVCDMLGASKAYNKDNWKPEMLREYWETKCKGKRLMDARSIALTEVLLYELCEKGETEFFKWYKANKDLLKDAYNIR